MRLLGHVLLIATFSPLLTPIYADEPGDSAFQSALCPGGDCSKIKDTANTPVKIEDALLTYALANASPCLRMKSGPANGCKTVDDAEARQVLAPVLVPEGRSLQSLRTNVTDPRLLFSLPLAANFRKEGLSQVKFDNTSGKLFVGYSGKANNLEVISYNNKTGKYDFLVVDNYPNGPIKVSNADQAECIKCHQNGGPIFPRAPWSETTASYATAQKMCNAMGIARKERDKNKPSTKGKKGKEEDGDNLYAGVKFADKCPPSRGSLDNVSTDFGRGGAIALDSTVRAASIRLQANRACQDMCGTNVECRRLLIKSALTFPFSSTIQSKLIDWSKPSSAEKESIIRQESGNLSGSITMNENSPKQTRRKPSVAVTRRRPGGSKTDTSSAEPKEDIDPLYASTKAKVDALSGQLDALLRPTWNADAYRYPSSTLPDRPNPSGDAQSITTSTAGDAETYAESNTVNNTRFLGASTTGDSRTGNGGEMTSANTPRPRVGGISPEVAGDYAMFESFDCLGFESADTRLLSACGSDPTKIDEIMSSSIVQTVAQEWPIASDADHPAVRDAVMKAAKMVCGHDAATESCGVTQDDMMRWTRDSVVPVQSPTELVNAAGDPAPPPPKLTSVRDRKLVKCAQMYCAQCHADSGEGMGRAIFPLKLEDPEALRQKIGHKSGKSIAELIQTPDTHPDDPMRMPPPWAAKQLDRQPPSECTAQDFIEALQRE